MLKSLGLKKYKHNLAGYLMICPSYVIYLVFIFVPVVMTFWYSFTNYDLYNTSDFVGLTNYIRMFRDPIFVKSIGNTFVYSLFTILPQIALGLLLAVLLNSKVYGRGFLRMAFYLPYLVSMVSVSMLWLWIYDPSFGVLNYALKQIGLPQRRWIYDKNLALFSIIGMSIWKVIGYNMLIYLAGLQQIPKELYEAATIDGASQVKQFFSVTLPLLAPTTFFLFVIGTIQSFSVFEQVNVMTMGGPANATTTMVHQIYGRAFEDFQMGYACSMGVLLLIITLILTLINFRYGRRGKDIEAA